MDKQNYDESLKDSEVGMSYFLSDNLIKTNSPSNQIKLIDP